jgi:cell division protein FtsB
MAKKRFTAKQLARVEGRIRLFGAVNHMLYIFMAVAFGLIITAFAVPQKKEYEKLQAKLRATQEREEETLARKEHASIELRALREDPAFLEVQARDRLNYYREGERVLRFDPNR